jgi:hypothetical protein
MATFTPGPWRIEERFQGRLMIRSIDATIAYVAVGEGEFEDANLIATAPELYRALEWAADILGDFGGCSCMSETDSCCPSSAARTALAKARGEQVSA